MNISRESLPHLSLTWFAVDSAGRIIAFRSLGEGAVPEFVRRSQEETLALFHHFYGQEDLSFSQAFDFRNHLDREVFPDRGLYVCLCDDPYGDAYRLVAVPEHPACLEEQPHPVRRLMQDHGLDLDISRCAGPIRIL